MQGMKKVVDYVHSKGLAFGLYTCGGTKTCVGDRPGSKDHWQQDADVFAEWVCIHSPSNRPLAANPPCACGHHALPLKQKRA